MEFKYVPEGVCPRLIEFSLGDDKTVHDVRFTGGCNGNLKAVGKLVEGMPAEQVCSILGGNTCGFKKTSCADQLSKALKEAMEEMK